MPEDKTLEPVVTTRETIEHYKLTRDGDQTKRSIAQRLKLLAHNQKIQAKKKKKSPPTRKYIRKFLLHGNNLSNDDLDSLRRRKKYPTPIIDQ